MAKSTQGLIFERLLDDLQTRITWVSFGDCRNLDASRIVGRYVEYKDQPDERKWDGDLPALIVSPPVRVRVAGSENEMDDVVYPFLLQIVDRDFSRANVDRLRTWMKWQEQIRKYFIEGRLRDTVAGVQRVTIGQRWLDKRLFRVFNDAVFFTIVNVEARENRNA